MKWFKITLSPVQVQGNEQAALRDQFIELYMAADEPAQNGPLRNPVSGRILSLRFQTRIPLHPRAD
jgi:hypothetical protein